MVAETEVPRERVAGRVWTVRLDPHGRPGAGAVRLSCSGAGCAERRLADAAAGRKAAVDHVKAHLHRVRAEGGPDGAAGCGCRAVSCAWHVPDPAVRAGRPRADAEPPRCGGPVVFTVYADRFGRLWRVAEVCSRCAAAVAGCRVVLTTPGTPSSSGSGGAPGGGGPGGRRDGPAGGTPVAAVFSDRRAAEARAAVPAARQGAAPRSAARTAGRIGKLLVPGNLEPEALRVELVELGDAFRAHQARPEVDLLLLAKLHARKARAVARWAEVSGNEGLRREAERAEKAAATHREMHANRQKARTAGDDGEGRCRSAC
jgi:hypothetical protein